MIPCYWKARFRSDPTFAHPEEQAVARQGVTFQIPDPGVLQRSILTAAADLGAQTDS